MSSNVYLVGAGPGDAKLITVKGLACIRKADVLVYDRLVHPNLLDEAKENCERIYVGKSSSLHTLSQAAINQLLIQKAKEGKIVIRLKGGDPYVFGRGAEEAEALSAQGIDFEVVPGITSAIGGLCYAGIPITHRDHASSFHVITGHLKSEDKALDWQTFAKLQGTLVFLMGVKNLSKISQNLIQAGMSPDTPSALISWATLPHQQTKISTLKHLSNLKVVPPTLVVIGDVVNLREQLNFFETKPLFGKNIIVTRAKKQNSQLVEKITAFGGNAIEVPTIQIKAIPNNLELEHEIRQLDNYQYLIFTSSNSVDIFFQKLGEMKKDSRALAGIKISAIGPQTGFTLQEKGISPDMMPSTYTLEGLAEMLAPVLKSTDQILIPKAKKTRSFLTDTLPGKITEVALYKTVIDTRAKEKVLHLLEEQIIDYITFTSATTVSNFVTLIGKENISKLKKIKNISIGPITSTAIHQAKLSIHKEAREATIDAIIETMLCDAL